MSNSGRLWTIKLRPGLRFHDGTPVRAVDCAASMRRWAGVGTQGRLAATVVESWDTPDKATMTEWLDRPIPILLDAMTSPMGKISIILPDEFNADSLVAYTHFAIHWPGTESPSWNIGAKTAFFDRVD